MAAILQQFTSAIPNNGDGDPLWSVYLGEDPNQTLTLSAGSAKIFTGSPSGGVYFDFRGRNGGWNFASNTYAQSKITSGTWDTSYNRLTSIFKTDCAVVRNATGANNLQIGTYIRYHTDPDTANQGDHYYHLFDTTFIPNKWFKVWMNGHPQHEVGGDNNGNWINNPNSLDANPVNYMDGLTRFYFDTEGSQADGYPAGYANTTWMFDNYVFDKVLNEPDYEVSSIIAGYTGTKYQVSWAAPRNTSITYDIRYSSASMKSPSSFSSGISGGSVDSTGNAYEGCFWTSPNISEYTSGIYIAIKPRTYISQPVTSVSGSFTEIYLPYQLSPTTDPLGCIYPTLTSGGSNNSIQVGVVSGTYSVSSPTVNITGNPASNPSQVIFWYKTLRIG